MHLEVRLLWNEVICRVEIVRKGMSVCYGGSSPWTLGARLKVRGLGNALTVNFGY
jgi:hypothetical protein